MPWIPGPRKDAELCASFNKFFFFFNLTGRPFANFKVFDWCCEKGKRDPQCCKLSPRFCKCHIGRALVVVEVGAVAVAALWVARARRCR